MSNNRNTNNNRQNKNQNSYELIDFYILKKDIENAVIAINFQIMSLLLDLNCNDNINISKNKNKILNGKNNSNKTNKTNLLKLNNNNNSNITYKKIINNYKKLFNYIQEMMIEFISKNQNQKKNLRRFFERKPMPTKYTTNSSNISTNVKTMINGLINFLNKVNKQLNIIKETAKKIEQFKNHKPKNSRNIDCQYKKKIMTLINQDKQLLKQQNDQLRKSIRMTYDVIGMINIISTQVRMQNYKIEAEMFGCSTFNKINNKLSKS